MFKKDKTETVEKKSRFKKVALAITGVAASAAVVVAVRKHGTSK